MSDTKDDGKAPPKLKLPGLPSAPRETAVGRAALAKTLVGHAAPAPPEATAWLNALLYQDAPQKVPPTTPTPPAPVATDAAPPPAPAADAAPPPAPVADAAPPPAPVADATPPAAVGDSVPAAPELPEAPPPVAVAAAEAAPPTPPPAAAPAVEGGELDTGALVAVGRKPGRVVLFALGPAAALAATIGLLVHRSHQSPPSEAPAPVTAEAPTPSAAEAPVPVAPPPAAAPAPEPHPPVEIGLDPTGGAQARAEEAVPNPVDVAAKPVDVAAKADESSGEERDRRHSSRGRQSEDDAQQKPASNRGGGRSPTQRGNALLQSGDAAGAVAAFQEAVRLAPDDADGYRGLGLAYEKQGKVPEAIDAFKHCLKLAKRSRDRQFVARQLYQLAHPE